MTSYPPSPRTDFGPRRACRVAAAEEAHDMATLGMSPDADGSAYDRFARVESRDVDLDNLGLAQKLALLDQLSADVSSAVTEGSFGELGVDDVLVANRVLDRCGRQVRSAQLEAVTLIDDKGVHLDDGFRSPKALLVHSLRLSGAAASKLTKAARALKAMPNARAAYAEGRIGTCQVDLIARLYGNPRIRDHVEQCDELFTEDASQVAYDDFAALLKEFARLADQDGAEGKDDRNHRHRDATLTQDFDGGWTLHGSFASTQGAAIKAIFDRFIETEFQADVEAAREQFGDDPSENVLERTAAQRRADALHAMVLQAATADPKAGLPVPLMSIVMHKADVEEAAARATGSDTPADPSRYRESRCSTDSGHHLNPRSVLTAALIGHIRRVVTKGDGVTIDLGRRRRLFTGSARDAALITQLRCNYATCGVPARNCQIDHLEPWSHTGPTNQDNAGPKCRFHNQWATNGYRTWRDPQGSWHTYRPDGTEII